MRRPSAAHSASKLRLPIGLVPEWLVAVGRDGIRAHFRICQHWDGRITLVPESVPPGKPCIAVVDFSLPFRRRLQRLPATSRARQALLKAAADEFPLATESVRYALGERDGEGYLYAMTEEDLAHLSHAGLEPAVVLVAAGEANQAGCETALETFETQGEAVSFVRGPRLLNRRWLRNGILVACLLGIAAGVAQLLLGPDLLGDAVAWRVQKLRREAGDLPRLYGATETMIASREAAAKLFAMRESNAPAVLGKLLATVPPGHSVRRIEISQSTLRVAGSGADVQVWLAEAGFPAEGIIIEKTGSFQAWRAERPL